MSTPSVARDHNEAPACGFFEGTNRPGVVQGPGRPRRPPKNAKKINKIREKNGPKNAPRSKSHATKKRRAWHKKCSTKQEPCQKNLKKKAGKML